MWFLFCLVPPDCGRDNSGERRERDRPPPGLKGREIGMWYARRGQAKREKEQKQNVNFCFTFELS